MGASSNRDRVVDVVVVGAGHNALTTAAYLAKRGLCVVVCERSDSVGGAAVTQELAPGFRVSSASYALSLLRPDVYTQLELARHGLVVTAKDPQMFVPLPDGRHFFVWRDEQRTQEALARISPVDADAYPRWCRFWAAAADTLRPLVDAVDPPPLADVEQIVGREIWRLAVAGSAAECVESFFSDPDLQGAFASQGVIGTWASVRDPGTAWVMAYHALGGEIYGGSGTWGFARGGMGAVSASLAAAAREAGAEILCASPVEEILVDDGAATGVRIGGGAVVRATIVVSGADPLTTFQKLVPRDALDDVFTDRIRRWRTPGCVLKVNLALRELPDFVARPGVELGPQHEGTIEISPSVAYLHDAYAHAQSTGASQRPFIEGFLQSAVDPTLVDGDGHVLSLFTQYVRDSGEDWEDTRTAATRSVIGTLGAYAPNVPDAIIACVAMGPPELEERFGLPGGNIFHGEILPEQSFGERFDYRTPIRRLYLCGSGARPGGGVMGAAGRNAARVVVDDL